MKQSSKRVLTVAVAGNPNSGKSTIFNCLTGLRQKVANYPGVTVEKKTGRCQLSSGPWVDVVDLPGAYSLVSSSPDETIAMEVLRGIRADTWAPDVIVAVVDASNLQRNLYLVSQLIELGRPMVVALNMMDIANRRGMSVLPERLERELGVPVVPVVGYKGRGIPELKKAVGEARVPNLPQWSLPQPMEEELECLASKLGDVESPIERKFLAKRLLIGDPSLDLKRWMEIDEIQKLCKAAMGRLKALGIDPMEADIETRYQWIECVSQRVVMMKGKSVEVSESSSSEVAVFSTLTDRIDSILIHKLWGLLIFALIMSSLFVSVFWLAQPLMDLLETGISWLGSVAVSGLQEGPLKALIQDGIFAGVGSVIVFVPQIAFLFLFLGVLEDSGYLARAAFLMDRLLSKVGLHGKSFIPLLSSFACAIPGVLATRTIENRKDRLATILVLPFMSCSARLPVYALLIGTFFAARGALFQAGVMLSLYALGILAAAGVAYLFKRSVFRGCSSPFILEMPSYKVPQIFQVARYTWTHTQEFIKRAGSVIFCLSVLLWALAYYPRLSETQAAKYQDEKVLASAQIENSFAGRLGKTLEPIIQPLGYDWKMGVGLVGAFAAREVFVSTLGIIYSVGDAEEEATDLSDAMKADRYPDGRSVWNVVVALSLLVWFVLAMQCMSTLAVVYRETGGWRWPAFMLLYMNGLAYFASFAIYQVGSIFLKV